MDSSDFQSCDNGCGQEICLISQSLDDIPLEYGGLFECVAGHTFCLNCFPAARLLLDEWWKEIGGEQRVEIPKDVCPICSPPPTGPSVMYSTDGEGHWWRREWAEQCPEEVFMADKCQGVKGHKGLHWCYKPDGSYAWDDNDDDPQEDGCSGSTPPDHKDYINPVDKQEDYWLSHYTDTEITDPALIERLENDDSPEGDGASINRPVNWEEMKENEPELYEELQERLKEIDKRKEK